MPGAVTETTHRVNYSETDQMGVVYHANYLVWLDVARTEHLRQQGMSYAELEGQGFRLVVADLSVRYRQPARYDDAVRVQCWVREAVPRRVTFGYAVHHAESDRLLATASTAMYCLDATMQVARMPAAALASLATCPDPVRL